MLQQNIKLIFRNFIRNKLFSFINILGLSIGMAASILIFLWIQDELNFDRFHEDHENKYRVIIHFENVGSPLYLTATPPALIPTLKQEIPEITDACRLAYYELKVKSKDDTFLETIYFTDKDYFNIFNYPILFGDLNSFDDPNSIVITEKMANKYFGYSDPIGRILTVDGQDEFIVKAIMKDIPANSSYQVEMLAPISNLKQFGFSDDNWNNWGWTSFINLSSQTDVLQVKGKLNKILLDQRQSVKEGLLQSIGNIHLYNRDGTPGQLKNIYIFASISFIILLIACFNYMNLSTAKSLTRSKETSIRKILGSGRNKLIAYFIIESVIFSLISLFIALIAIEIIRPSFNTLVGKEIAISYGKVKFILLLVGIGLLTGLLAGLYPALKLSNSKGAQLISKNNLLKTKKGALRQILVISQFSVSIILIIATIVVSLQLNYLLNKDLGIDHDDIMYLKIDGSDIGSNYEGFKQELLNNPNIKSLTRTYQMPSYNMLSVDYGNPEEADNTFPINVSIGDHDYIKTFGLELIDGRDFDLALASDSFNVIINEKAAKLIGKEDLIGERTRFWHDGQLIGIMKDYHFMPLNKEIEPIAIVIDPEMFRFCAIKLLNGKHKEGIAHIEKTFKEFAGDYPFEIKFMDNDYQEIYESENRQGKMYSYFSYLAIFIACLGLFGLSAFMAEQKTKEIAVRKVNGANVSGIVLLMNKQFLKWVLFSIIIAVPVAWYWMNNWLQEFVYRINLNPMPFIIAGVIAILIAFLTTAIHAMRAANRNPVESLRYE